MLLPASVYGDARTVMRSMREVATKVAGGESFIEEMTRNGLVDTADRDGYIAINARLPGGAAQFHVDLPLSYLFEMRAKTKLDAKVESRVFAEAISTSWGILCLLPANLWPWVYKPERRRSFIDALADAWAELESVGARYCGTLVPEELWGVATNAQYVLAKLGVPPEKLNKPLPRAGLRALIPPP